MEDIVRKILIVIINMLFLVSFVGCNEILNKNSEKRNMEMQEINFIEIESSGINWEQIEFPIDLSEIECLNETKSIESKQDAIKIAKTIIEKCHEKDMFCDYTLLSIIYSKNDNIWRFDYSIDQRSKDKSDLMDCGNLYVAIDGNEGKLIKAWIEE